MSELTIRIILLALGFLLGWMKRTEKEGRKKRRTRPAFYDKSEIVEGCTVQILTNTKTGEVSIGWWYGGMDDMPTISTQEDAK